jgi:hypothetical protein
MASGVVVDTMIASAWLGVRETARKERWAPLLERSVWVLPFTVVAEMRFGAEVRPTDGSRRWPSRRSFRSPPRTPSSTRCRPFIGLILRAEVVAGF